MSALETYIESNKDRFENLFFELLRIPSISAAPERKPDMFRAVNWLQNYFSDLGAHSEVIPTDGHPIFYAETKPVSGAPVVLVYGHYDVQPPEPLELWKTPPFEPCVRDGNVYARGATDDKGQFLTHVFGLEAWLKSGKNLPVQLKFLIEGEEEVGSGSLGKLLESKANQSKWDCDCVVVSDSSMFGPGQPALTCGLRGIMGYELFLTGPNRDLHSGDFGGTLVNPAIALSVMLSKVIDANGRIKIPHFYDDVRPITPQERSHFSMLPFNESEFFQRIGLKSGCGEAGYSTLERRWARPTFDINGLTSGYQGAGSKTIIPQAASAKFSFRLVPDQQPEKLKKEIENFFQQLLPPGITMRLEYGHGAAGMLVDLESKYVGAAANALEYAFDRPPVYTRQGGSIPIVSQLSRDLNADVLLIGLGLDDDNLHAPNEKFSLQSFHQGIVASSRLWSEICRI